MFNLQQSLGIEFKGRSLRLVHLAKTFGGYKLLNFLEAALPTEDISASDYQEAVIAQLEGFIQEHNIKLSEAVVGLPPSEIALRHIEMPVVERAELHQMLEYEIESHLPFTSHELYFDFLIEERKEDTQGLLLLAARRDRVDQYLALVAQAGLKCIVVDFVPLAITNLLHINNVIGNANNGSTPRNCLLVDVGQEAVSFSRITSGQLVMARSRPITELGVIIPLKSEQAETPPDAVMNPDERADELAGKIAKEIDCWQNSLFDKADQSCIEHIFVLNEGDTGELICRRLEEQTHIEASIPANWQVIKSDADEVPSGIESAAGTALALRGMKDSPWEFNLLPLLQRQPPKKSGMLLTMSLVGLAVILITANLVGFFLKDRLALARINQQAQQLEPQLKAIAELEEQYKQLQLQLDSLRSFKPKTVTTLDILKEITLRLPAGAWLQKLDIQGNTVEISGRAESASSLIPLIEESSLFEDVKFTSTITSREGEKEKFKIKMTLEVETGAMQAES